MEEILVLGCDDNIYTCSYGENEKAYKTTQKAVGGMFEYFDNVPMKLELGNVKRVAKIDFICNEEFLIDDNIQKVNALTERLTGRDDIYGDVAVLIDLGNGKNRGFTEVEKNLFVDVVEDLKETFKERIEKLHEEKDNNKELPEFYVY